MFKKIFSPFLLTLISLFVFNSLTKPAQAGKVKFVCSTDSGNIPTTYAQTPDGAVEVFKWTSNFFNPPYTPMQRCFEVTDRMNKSNPTELSTGKVRGYNVICFGKNCDPSGSNILITLKPNQNPNQVLYEIDQNREGAGGPSRQLGNGSTTSKNPQTNVTTNGDGSITFDLSGYLQRAPKIPKVFNDNSQPSQAAPTSTKVPLTSPTNNTNPVSKPGSLW